MSDCSRPTTSSPRVPGLSHLGLIWDTLEKERKLLLHPWGLCLLIWGTVLISLHAAGREFWVGLRPGFVPVPPHPFPALGSVFSRKFWKGQRDSIAGRIFALCATTPGLFPIIPICSARARQKRPLSAVGVSPEHCLSVAKMFLKISEAYQGITTTHSLYSHLL